VMWIVAFAATGAAALLSWTAHRLRRSIEATLRQVERNEQRTVEHRIALEREDVEIPDIKLVDGDAYADGGD